MIKLRSIRPGSIVYHGALAKRGPGIVQEIRRTARKVRVTWANNLGGFDTRVTWCSLSELRQAPKT